MTGKKLSAVSTTETLSKEIDEFTIQELNKVIVKIIGMSNIVIKSIEDMMSEYQSIIFERSGRAKMSIAHVAGRSRIKVNREKVDKRLKALRNVTTTLSLDEPFSLETEHRSAMLYKEYEKQTRGESSTVRGVRTISGIKAAW